MSLPRLEHGARLILTINGSLIGAVTNFSFTNTTNRVDIRGIDLLHSQEIGPSSVIVNGTINLLRPLGIGGAQGIGLLAQSSDIPNEKYVTLLMTDLVTDQNFFKSDYVQVLSESWTVSPKQYTVGTINFTAINYTNETST